MTATLQDAALTAAQRPEPTPGTWQDSEPPTFLLGQTATQLDYFFVNDRVQVQSYAVDTTLAPTGQYASDHFPVTVTVMAR
jgi:endonuclease/exonuclease/phosphatase family metal-dependent hydrolase